MGRIQKVSIRDLAAHSGFSPMTVSRALRDSPQVNPQTKAKIQAVADELGYSLNPLVSANMAAIRSNRSVTYQATIAIIHNTPPGGHWANTLKIVEAAKERAKEIGFVCDLFDLADPEVARSNLARIFKSRGIQGAIQRPMALNAQSRPIDLADLAIVSCDPGSLPQKLHRVCPDYYGNMDMMLKRIRKRGQKRIGLLVARDLDARLNHLWTSRFLAFQQTEGLPQIPIYVPETRDHYNPEKFRSWFDKNRPDIIIMTTDSNFRERFFQESGLKIPGDVKLVKVNINNRRKGISGIDEESHEVGTTAVNTLAQLLFQNQRGLLERPLSVLIPGKWIEADEEPIFD